MAGMANQGSDTENHFSGRKRVSTRFFYNYIFLFITTAILIAVVMIFLTKESTKQISEDYVRLNALNAANPFEVHINRIIGLMLKSSGSSAITDWYEDYNNPDKKSRAYEEITGLMSMLEGKNLILSMEDTRQSYVADKTFLDGDIRPGASIDQDNPNDTWYFNCVNSGEDYVIRAGEDKLTKETSVWIDCIVKKDDKVLGVLTTSLNFTDIASALFIGYSSDNIYGMVIDEMGYVRYDGQSLDDLSLLKGSSGINAADIFPNSSFVNGLNEYITGINGHFNPSDSPRVIPIPDSQYSYAAISPISETNWSVVTLFASSSAFGFSDLLPVLFTTLLIFAFFAALTCLNSYRFVLRPLKQLIDSLEHLKERNDGSLYGLARNDEFGILSNTIYDLFMKGNYDPLTGARNRRFLEINLQYYINLLARTNSMLSILFIDVDNFKRFNDNYGHIAGDEFLKTAADAISRCLSRNTDFVARYGGDEFVAVLPNADRQGACLVADRMLEYLRNLKNPYEKNEAAPGVTISIGVTSGLVKYGYSWTEYIKRADAAAYMSKQKGRNNYTFWGLYDTVESGSGIKI